MGVDFFFIEPTYVFKRSDGRHILGPHQPQPSIMGGDAGPERRMLSVFHTVFATGFFHDPCDRRVMNMADRREKVMLKVKVQSTEGPAQDRALPVKAKGCLRSWTAQGASMRPAFSGRGKSACLTQWGS